MDCWVSQNGSQRAKRCPMEWAEDVGRLARRLTTSLYVHAAALELVRDPRVRDLTRRGNPVGGHPPAGLVQRKDGTLTARRGPVVAMDHVGLPCLPSFGEML
jgi:hypothetical protein